MEEGGVTGSVTQLTAREQSHTIFLHFMHFQFSSIVLADLKKCAQLLS